MNRLEGHILILEDDESWQANYRDITAKHGYTCSVVDNALDAQLKLVRSFFHLVIVDLSLTPDDPRNNDGLRVLKWIKHMNEGTQGLVATGYPFPESIRDAFRDGAAFDLVEKSKSLSEIESAVIRGISMARQRMHLHIASPGSQLNVDFEALHQSLGIHRTQLRLLIDNIMYLANNLLEDRTPGERTLPFDLQRIEGMLPLLQQRQPARVITTKPYPIIVLRYWDRLFERCLELRISEHSQIQQEHEFFATHAEAMRKLGMLRISKPFYEGGFGGVLYHIEESGDLFAEFEHPWGDLLSSPRQVDTVSMA